MLNLDPLTNSERKLPQLPLEARHSICLEIAKKKRQSVASSIFLPKEHSLKLRLRKMNQKKEKSATSCKRIQKTSMDFLAKQMLRQTRRKKLKNKTTHIPKPNQTMSLILKHPESFPIQRQTVTSERIRTVVENLKEHNEPERTVKTTVQSLEAPDMPSLEQMEVTRAKNNMKMDESSEAVQTVRDCPFIVEPKGLQHVGQTTKEEGQGKSICHETFYSSRNSTEFREQHSEKHILDSQAAFRCQQEGATYSQQQQHTAAYDSCAFTYKPPKQFNVIQKQIRQYEPYRELHIQMQEDKEYEMASKQYYFVSEEEMIRNQSKFPLVRNQIQQVYVQRTPNTTLHPYVNYNTLEPQEQLYDCYQRAAGPLYPQTQCLEPHFHSLRCPSMKFPTPPPAYEQTDSNNNSQRLYLPTHTVPNGDMHHYQLSTVAPTYRPFLPQHTTNTANSVQLLSRPVNNAHMAQLKTSSYNSNCDMHSQHSLQPPPPMSGIHASAAFAPNTKLERRVNAFPARHPHHQNHNYNYNMPSVRALARASSPIDLTVRTQQVYYQQGISPAPSYAPTCFPSQLHTLPLHPEAHNSLYEYMHDNPTPHCCSSMQQQANNYRSLHGLYETQQYQHHLQAVRMAHPNPF